MTHEAARTDRGVFGIASARGTMPVVALLTAARSPIMPTRMKPTTGKPASAAKPVRKLLAPKVKSTIGRARLREAVKTVQASTEAA